MTNSRAALINSPGGVVLLDGDGVGRSLTTPKNYPSCYQLQNAEEPRQSCVPLTDVDTLISNQAWVNVSSIATRFLRERASSESTAQSIFERATVGIKN